MEESDLSSQEESESDTNIMLGNKAAKRPAVLPTSNKISPALVPDKRRQATTPTPGTISQKRVTMSPLEKHLAVVKAVALGKIPRSMERKEAPVPSIQTPASKANVMPSMYYAKSEM